MEDLEDEEDLMYILKTVKVDADFLEQVGFYGSVNSSKLNKLEDQLISIEDEKKAVKKICSTLEDACDIYMYFNGNRADKQAYLGFEPMLDDDEWYVEPVIRFSDGSSYQLVEDYFSENNFESILNRLENRLEEIEGWAENNF